MPHDWAMADGKVRLTPEEEHLPEQARLFSELIEQLAHSNYLQQGTGRGPRR